MDEIAKRLNGRFDVLQETNLKSIDRFIGLMRLSAESGVDFDIFYKNFNIQEEIEGYNVHLRNRGLLDFTIKDIKEFYNLLEKIYSPRRN